jgi:hypothetical protein
MRWPSRAASRIAPRSSACNVERTVDLGDQIAASGGPPSPEQQAEMDRIGSALQRHGKLDLILLLLAITAMSTARYW